MAGNFDIVQAVVEHRLRQDDLDELLGPLDAHTRDELSRKVQDLLSRISGLIEINNSASGALSLYALLPRLNSTVAAILHAADTLILLNDARRDELYAPMPKGEDEVRFKNDQGITGSVFQTGKTEIVVRPASDPRFLEDADTVDGIDNLNILCAPMLGRDEEKLGVIRVSDKLGKGFQPEDVDMLDALIAQAAPALENSLIFETFKKARRDEAQIMEITNALSEDLQLDTLLAKIMTGVTDILDADRSTIFLYDKRKNELWSRIASGIGAKEIRFPADKGIAGTVFQTGETINIPDAYSDPRFNKEVDKQTGYHTQTILCMPIHNKQGERIGVTQVLNKEGGEFVEEDEQRLRGFSAHVSIALENATLFESVLNMKNYNESILKSLSNGVITLDEEGHIIKVNEAGEEILGLREADVLDDPLDNVFGNHNAWVCESVRKVQETGEADLAVDTEFYQKGEETPKSVNLTAVPLISPEGKSIGSMLIFEDITSEKRLKSTMTRYMAKEVVDQLLDGGESILGGAQQEATVLFSDIRSFTTLSEVLGAKGTVTMLNDYFEEMVEVIFLNSGVLDKFIGDAIMAIFGAPFSSDLDADNAVAAANGMMVALRNINERRASCGENPISIGVGLSTGEVVAGNIGSTKRMDYTVIGDTVNLASRLEGATKYYGAGVLVSGPTVDCIKNPSLFRPIDFIRVKGKNRPVEVYEACDHMKSQNGMDVMGMLDLYNQAVTAYRGREFGRAGELFGKALDIYPDDGPSKLYVQRCQAYLADPPPANWDGVFTMTEK